LGAVLVGDVVQDVERRRLVFLLRSEVELALALLPLMAFSMIFAAPSDAQAAAFDIDLAASGEDAPSLSLGGFLKNFPFVREASAALSPPFRWSNGQSVQYFGNSDTLGVEFKPTEAVYFERSVTFNWNGTPPETRYVSGTGEGPPDCRTFTPRPNIVNFSASPNPIYLTGGATEGNTTLSWDVRDADTCAIGGLGSVNSVSGSRTITLSSSQTYTIACVNSCYGQQDPSYDSVYVSVITTPDEPPPEPTDLTVDIWADDYSVNEGSGTRLYWDASPNAEWCDAYGGWENGGNKNTSNYGGEYTGDLYGYTTFWLTCGNDSGQEDTDSVSINVVSTAAPSPYVEIWASPNPTDEGNPTRLEWYVEDANICYTNGPDWWTTGDKPFENYGTTGEDTPDLYEDTYFQITCENNAGETDTAYVDVSVDQPGSGINFDFWAVEDEINSGQTATLRWTTYDPIDFCFTGGGGWGSGEGRNTGSQSETVGPLTEQTDYYLLCGENGGDSQTKSATVYIKEDPSTPRIIDFSANPATVDYEQSSELTWETEYVSSCTLENLTLGTGREGVSTQQSAPGRSTGPMTIAYTYILRCTDGAESDRRSLTISIASTFFLYLEDGKNTIEATVVEGKPTESTPIKIMVDPIGNFSSAVSFSLANEPFSGVTASFEPSEPLTGFEEYGDGTEMTLNVPGDAQEGTYTVTVAGSGGGDVRTIDITLNLTVIKPEFKEF